MGGDFGPPTSAIVDDEKKCLIRVRVPAAKCTLGCHSDVMMRRPLHWSAWPLLSRPDAFGVHVFIFQCLCFYRVFSLSNFVFSPIFFLFFVIRRDEVHLKAQLPARRGDVLLLHDALLAVRFRPIPSWRQGDDGLSCIR